jgi:ABC-type nitrate/sulfonate/bicarbonate transport system substrate-binding protein
MADRLPIRLAAGSGPTFGVDDLACAAATHLKCWHDEGLDVTWTPVHGGVAAMNAVLDGTVDVGYGGLGPAIRGRAEGAPLRVVVSMARGLAQNLVAQSRITEPAQLRGVSWALDGIGALSHHMARLTIAALGIADDDIDWQVLGPPPQRIERLVSGGIDVSLIRVEEAMSLSQTHAGQLHTLLGFADLKRLVPLQPHGVLATTEAYEAANPEALARLARGMIKASRALHDDYATFRKVYDAYVTVPLPDGGIETIWQSEHDTGGFAVNGEMSTAHWDAQLASYAALNPDLARFGRDDLLAGRFVADALSVLGRHDSDFDHTGD